MVSLFPRAIAVGSQRDFFVRRLDDDAATMSRSALELDTRPFSDLCETTAILLTKCLIRQYYVFQMRNFINFSL